MLLTLFMMACAAEPSTAAVSSIDITPQPARFTPPVTSPADPPPTRAMTSEPTLNGTIVASVFRHGHWDLYTLSPEGQLLKRLTFGDGDNRAPAWSPDGTRIAFESNRNHNWDIYVLNADGTNLQRLTTHPRFDGSPQWSPDGSRMAFTSERDGDLDIWVMNVDGTDARNLTSSTPAQDYDPRWSANGAQIAFTSLRDGNKEIYLMNADGSNPHNLTQSPTTDEEHPAWSADGRRLAFVSERQGAREIYVLNLETPQRWQRVTALEYHQWPAWSPDGSSLVFVAQSEQAQPLELVRLGQPFLFSLTHDRLLYRQPDWSARALSVRDEASLQRDDTALYAERTRPNPPSRPDRYNFVPLKNVKAVVPMLSDAVDDSFMALRQRVLAESGWDFLSELSEAARPLTFRSIASDYLSWHKAGRAIDVLWDFVTPQGKPLEVAREDILAETFWRVYLRTANQDGSQGEPLRQVIWDVSAGTRRQVFPRGGIAKSVLNGYYIDLTELARQFGWRRIPSLTRPDFDWHRDFYALEYWHYQKTDGLSWWQAIHEIYAPQEIGNLFSYPNLLKAKYDVLTMIEKGIPVPPEVLEKYQALEP